MKTMVEVTWIEEVNEETVTKTDKYWLLYWGLKFDIVNDVAVNYTVAICSHLVTGQVEMFSPDQLKILGTEIK
jgi:hypothetical protein